MSVEAFERISRIGWASVPEHRKAMVFVTVKWDGRKLSISGVEGPKRNGDAFGSCGQIADHLLGYEAAELVDIARLRSIWLEYHLNDMQAGCEHQQRMGWGHEEIEVISYGLTTAAYQMREAALDELLAAFVESRPVELGEKERALLALTDWFKDRYALPDEDSPLAGCYELKKREANRSGWVKANEHPDGVLCKPCPECGYRYGTGWHYKEVPDEALEFLAALPDYSAIYPWKE